MKIRESVPGYGGKPPSRFVALALPVALILASAGLWIYSTGEGGFSEVERLGSVKCLGCLGLNPIVPGFDGEFWIQYPEEHENKGENVSHPEIVHEILDDPEWDLLILFFWAQGCVPCAEQWEEMREKDIASGPEEDGKQGDAFERVRIISVDANEDPHGFYGSYIPTGKEDGVPMTTFLFKDDGGMINWYSRYGRMDVDNVEGMINLILYEEISHA